MTKTFAAVIPYRCGSICLPVIMPFCTNTRGSGVWDFEFGSLEFVCYLVFGAWNFYDFHESNNFRIFSQLAA